jgi:hypothetical protein
VNISASNQGGVMTSTPLGRYKRRKAKIHTSICENFPSKARKITPYTPNIHVVLILHKKAPREESGIDTAELVEVTFAPLE